MKVLIMHLSDTHCKASSNYEEKIKKAVEILPSSDKYEKVILAFTGDLTNSAAVNEFRVGKSMIGLLLSELSQKFNCGFIETLIVPGNHDMILTDNDRTTSDILSWNLDEHINDEIGKLSNFFQYSASKKCFSKDKLIDIRKIETNEFKIKVTLINSAPYSTRKRDNKEIHYIPSYASDKMGHDGECDFNITLMHHSYEWYNWNSKEMLKKCFSNEDIVLFGHDHQAETICMKDGKGNVTNIIYGGQFSLTDKPCSFNTVILDSETENIEVSNYTWISGKNIFKADKQEIDFKRKSKNNLSPLEDYINNLANDPKKLSTKFTDYYVLPKLKTDSDSFTDDKSKEINIDELFDTLCAKKVIAVRGNNYSGKTSLIKYLYLNAVDKGLIPILIEKGDYKDSRIEKLFKNMIEIQYGDREYTYDLFKASPSNKVVVFIDDFDLIDSDKARENLFSYIVNAGYLLVYTTKDYVSQNLTTLVKEKLQSNSVDSVEILPFYKEKRDKLVRNLCNINGQKNEAESIIFALDYMVQCRAELFSLTPNDLLQYIKYFMNKSDVNDKGVKTISIVFETNIRNSMIEAVASTDVNTYLSALEYLSNYMYFTQRSETVSVSQLENVINEFNEKRRSKINAKVFAEKCCKAKILIEVSDKFEYSFCDNNTFAYFIAKYVNWEIEKNNTNLENLYYIMNHICFGINDLIILFLSYVRSNSRIILQIAAKAIELLDTTQELDFDKNNIPFLKKGKYSLEGLPTEKEKKENIKNTEIIESQRQEMVKFRGIFDFNEDDVEKKKYVLLRAFKYTQLIGRTLVDQYGSLETDEINSMVSIIYRTTQKVLYEILKPYDENYAKIIQDLSDFVKENNPDQEISKEKISEIFNRSAVNFLLSMMNDIAYNSSNSNTVVALDEIDLYNTNYKIQNLMMCENSGDSNSFVEKAIKLNKEFDDSNNLFGRWLVSAVAHKHVLYNADINKKSLERLISGNVLRRNDKKEYLLKKLKEKN